MNTLKFWIINILLIVNFTLQATEVKNTTFKNNEELTYDLSYKWGIINISAAQATFSVKECVYKGQNAYHLLLTGKTYKTFDSFYTVRDSFISYATRNTLTPLFYKRIAHEDSYWAEDHLTFQKQNSKQTTLSTICFRKKSDPKKDTLQINQFVTDLVTACYRLRNIDFASLKINDRAHLPIIYDDSGEAFDINLRFLGTETIKVNNKKISCIKLKPTLVKGGIFPDENGMTIWVSNDKNKIPILIEAKIKVGAIRATISNVKNSKYPSDYTKEKKA